MFHLDIYGRTLLELQFQWSCSRTGGADAHAWPLRQCRSLPTPAALNAHASHFVVAQGGVDREESAGGRGQGAGGRGGCRARADFARRGALYSTVACTPQCPTLRFPPQAP